MCGIAGFYDINSTRSKAEQKSICDKMEKALHHRGPDSAGLWQDPEINLNLAHRRLSILDLTKDGAQPMASQTERYVIIFNGEIYNFLELKKQLEDGGMVFRGRSDTEVILAATEYWGLNQTLQKLSGMFAFALWDRKTRTLHFARDRLGKKPLYIGWAGQGKNLSLTFASELKALRAHPDFKAAINQQTANAYMQTGWINAPQCIYEDVIQLPAGHRLSIELEKLTDKQDLLKLINPYWSAPESAKINSAQRLNMAEHEIIELFEKQLSTCTAQRMISDVPLGAFLSGGIDSSLITALMQKQSNAPVKTYSIGFENAAFNEAEHAKDIAKHLGTEHHEHYCTSEDALNVIPKLPLIYDEPFADQSAIPTYLVSAFARKHVTVALSGDGGDELMGGYNRHLQGPKIARIISAIPHPIRALAAALIKTIPPQTWQSLKQNSPLFGQHIHKMAHSLSAKNIEQLYERMLGSKDAQYLFQNPALPKVEGLSASEHLMLWDVLTYLPGDVLTKVDRASMACSLEIRSPLLDHRLFELSYSIPQNLKIRNGKGKYLLRQILQKHIPEQLFERPKQGFNIPLDEWLRTDLKDWAHDLLDETALKQHAFMNHKQIKTMWNAHLNGKGNHAQNLWAVIMFQSWYKQWMNK